MLFSAFFFLVSTLLSAAANSDMTKDSVVSKPDVLEQSVIKPEPEPEAGSGKFRISSVCFPFQVAAAQKDFSLFKKWFGSQGQDSKESVQDPKADPDSDSTRKKRSLKESLTKSNEEEKMSRNKRTKRYPPHIDALFQGYRFLRKHGEINNLP